MVAVATTAVLQQTTEPFAMEELEVTVLMPCLNEAETVATCVQKARSFLQRTGTSGEVLVADNGWSDGSQAIAREAGARVVDVPAKGYGSALLGGIAGGPGPLRHHGRRGRQLRFFAVSMRFSSVAAIRSHHGDRTSFSRRHRPRCDAVVAPLSRQSGSELPRPSVFLLSIGDFHCGLRGFDRAAALRLGLSSPGWSLRAR